MTEYLEVFNGTAKDIQVGDRVTFTVDGPDEWGDIVCTARRIPHSGHIQVMIWDVQGPSIHILRVERPVLDLPTKPCAVVFPYDAGLNDAYVLSDQGVDWLDMDMYIVRPQEFVLERLAAGTHYIAFEGVSGTDTETEKHAT